MKDALDNKQEEFEEVLSMITLAKQHAYRVVNTTLIDLYLNIGSYISKKIENAQWGDAVVSQLADFISSKQPGASGFTRRNLFRMRQVFETYRKDNHLSMLVRQLPWSHNVIIVSQSRNQDEREFYLKMSIREKWGKRELEHQFKNGLFERIILNPPKVSPAATLLHPSPVELLKDLYFLDFLEIPKDFIEFDLQKALISKLKNFLVELGRDFCFVGSEYLVQVGNRDFAIDLLFFHRALNCLVAIELKIGRFEPEHLGKLSFYLEALDRTEKKPHENPAFGILLCASKDEETVEYSLSRTLSPALVAQYKLELPDKKLLRSKLQEFYQQKLLEREHEV